MKLLSAIALLLLSAIFFVSCQKELNWDLSAQSQGTLKADSTTNECLPIVVQGTYIVDSALGSTNYIDVQVDVTTVGIYQIQSDTINGVSFYGAGTFGNTGINTVRLMGSGTPTASGLTTFIISYINNNSTCTVDVEVLPASTNPNAVFIFGGAGTTCTGFTLAGSYMQSLPLTSGNTVSLNVSVTSGGVYTLATPVVNGVSFTASGSISTSNTGITLIGSGTPTTTGTFNYLVSGGGGSSCTFSVTFDAMTPPAVYTLGGSPSGCTGFSLLGNYDVGVAMNSSNSTTIDVNVTNTGSYSISSIAANGVTFAATGVFTTTGPQQVILYASGTPTAAGTFDHNISNGSQSCTLSVTYTGTATNYITCDLNGVFTTFNIGASAGLSNAAGYPILSIDGNSVTLGTDPTINIQIGNINGGSINPSTYDVNQLAIGFLVSCNYYDATSIYSMASDPANQNQNPGFTVTVTSLSGSRCVGTFSGTLKDALGNPITVTNGIFNVPF